MQLKTCHLTVLEFHGRKAVSTFDRAKCSHGLFIYELSGNDGIFGGGWRLEVDAAAGQPKPFP